MQNIFDQFDEAEASALPVENNSQENVFDQFDEPAPTRSYGDVATDIGSGLAKGVNSLGAAEVQAVDAYTTFMQKTNPIRSVLDHYFPERAAKVDQEYRGMMDGAQEQFQSGEEYWQDKKSEKIKADSKYVSEGDGFVDTLSRVKDRPQVILDVIADSAAYMLPGGWAARAIKAAPAAAGMTAGAVFDASSTGVQAKREVMGMTPEQLMERSPDYKALVESGVPEDEAKAAMARDAGFTAQAIQLPISFLASKLSGAGKLESDLFTGKGVGGFFSSILKEIGEGGTQEASAQVAQNTGVKLYGDDQRTVADGVGNATAMGTIAGGVQGGAIKGAASALNSFAKPVEDSGIDTPTTEQLHVGVDTSTHIPSEDEVALANFKQQPSIIDELPSDIEASLSQPISIDDEINQQLSELNQRYQQGLMRTQKAEPQHDSFVANVKNYLSELKAQEQLASFSNPDVRAQLDAPDSDLASAARKYGEETGLISPPKDPNVVDYVPPKLDEKPAFSLAPLDQPVYDNTIDFEKPDRTNSLASGVEKAISENIDQKRRAQMPENLRDTRLLRSRYRKHLEDVVNALDSHSGALVEPDSLLDSVSKNGGLNAAAWSREGIDPADAKLVNNSAFRKIFRNDGGMTPDDVAEFAAQRGFIGFTNAQGAPDANVALNAITDELQGKKKYSAEDESILQAAQAAPKFISELKEFGSSDTIKRALSLALEGKKLGSNQLRIVQEVLDNTNSHVRDDAGIKEKWESRARTMLANRANKQLDEWRNRDELLPEATTYEAALNEIMADAIQRYGIDAEAVKAAYDKYSAKFPDMNSLVMAMNSWVSASKPDTKEHLSYGQEKSPRESSGQRGTTESGARLSPESQVRETPAAPRRDAPTAQGKSGSDSAGRDSGLRQSVGLDDAANVGPVSSGGNWEKSLLLARRKAISLGIKDSNKMKMPELVKTIKAEESLQAEIKRLFEDRDETGLTDFERSTLSSIKSAADSNDELSVRRLVKEVRDEYAGIDVEINPAFDNAIKKLIGDHNKKPSIEGKEIDGDWAEFSKDSGSIGIPRAEMPQIKAEHRGAMVNFMNARDIAHQEETLPADTLKPTQKEFSREKVTKAKDFDGGNRSILVSSDNHVLDGHHQWMAAREKGEDVKVIRLDAPIKKLVEVAHEFPSSTTDTAFKESAGKGVKKYVKPESQIKYQSELQSRLRNGEVTIAEFKEAFASLTNDRERITSELSSLTKDKLIDLISGYSAIRAKSEKKDYAIRAAYESLITQYYYAASNSSMFSYSGGGKDYIQGKIDAVKPVVDAATQENLDAYAKEYADAIQEREENKKRKLEGMQDPKTLEDFRNLHRAILNENENMTQADARMQMSLEQRAEYDRLSAIETRVKRIGEKAERKTAVSSGGQLVGGTIIETKHTKKGHDLFVVQLEARVSKDDYTTLAASAKRLGGYYSSFRGAGAVPGFQFTTSDDAKAFLELAGGNTEAASQIAKEKRDAFEDDKSQSTAERLRTMAAAMNEHAEHELTRDRKSNTSRRAGMAARALESAEREKAMAETMVRIADGIESGALTFLDKLRTKAQLSQIQAAMHVAKGDEIRKKYDSYAEQLKHEGEPITAETVDYATWPTYTAYRSDLAKLARQMVETDGLKKLGNDLLKVADDTSAEYMAFAKENLHKVSTFQNKDGAVAVFKTKKAAALSIEGSGFSGKAIPFEVKRGENLIILSSSEAAARGIWSGSDKKITLAPDFVEKLIEQAAKKNRKKENVSVPWQLETAYEKRQRYKSMGIENAAEFRAALREYVGIAKQPGEMDKIKKLELAMVGRKKDGLDFFPTPQALADEMINAAGIQAGMSVLEPSAGMGHIADRIRAFGVEPDVVEISSERRELLEAKGYNLVGNDFTEFKNRDTFGYGDTFRAEDGSEGILRGQGGLGSDRVRLVDENGEGVGKKFFSMDELTPVKKNGAGSGYDRIIMNPPFSDRRDMEHVLHAYDLLKPGGRIVAIVGEGVMFGSDKKAAEFRAWLDELGATAEKLEEGTFNDPSLPVTTGVNARMLVIDKPEETDKGVLLYKFDDTAQKRMERAVTQGYITDIDQLYEEKVNEQRKGIEGGGGQISGGLIEGNKYSGNNGGTKSNTPATFYHGTSSDFSGFDFTTGARRDAGWLGQGVYVTDRPELASSYANTAPAGNAEPNVIPVHIRLKNPKILTLDDKRRLMGLSSEAAQAFTKKLQSQGYDGAILAFKDVKEIVVFDPRNIRSVNAEFDPDKTDSNNLLHKIDSKPHKSISKESAQAIVDRISKNWKVKVKINLIGSISELPESVKSRLHKADDEQAEPAALIDESTGHVYINLARAEDERTIEQLIFHEVYTHFGLRQLMGSSVSAIMTRLYLNLENGEFDRLAKKYDVNVEAYKSAYQDKPGEYRQAILAEELLAHMAEHSKPKVLQIVREFIGAVRSWLRQNGFMELSKISESDMRYLLKQARETVTKGKQGNVSGLIYSLAGISKSERKQLNAQRSSVESEPVDDERSRDDDLLAAWGAISRNEESFQLPYSRKKDLAGIAQDLEGLNGFRVYEADELALMNNHKAERAWRVVTPKGEKAALYERGDKVWIDVSDLESGENGKRIYNMVANYAYNNGKVFMGDPAGLSDTAMARRLENMLSSALKFGTTAHIMPHKRQLEGGAGVPPLKWRKGDHEGNIRNMILASYEAVRNQIPEIENIVYNPEKDIFERTDSGKEVTHARFNRLAADARGELASVLGQNGSAEGGSDTIGVESSERAQGRDIDGSGVRESAGQAGALHIGRGLRASPSAGRTTLERAILTGSILRGTRSERSAILAALSQQRSERLNDILYSLGKDETRSQGGFSFMGRKKVSSLPPSLQESFSRLGQKQTLSARIKTELKRQLTPEGLLPKEIFSLKVARDGEMNADELHTKLTLQSFYDAIENAYGIPYKNLKAGTKREINKILRGEPSAQLAPSVIKALGVMRDDIKRLSKVYVEQLVADAAELKAQGREAEANAKLATVETVSANFDTYLHRSYRAFDDKEWPSKVPENVYQNAVNFLASEYADGGKITADHIKQAEKRAHMILHEGTAFDSIGAFISESKLGSKDLSIMKKRKDVPEPIRALLGEYEDAAMNYTKSVTKMSRLVHNHAFLTGMKEAAFDLGLLHEKQNLELDATKKIAAEGSESYAPLNGLYTTREFEQALKDAMGKTNPNAIYDAIVAANGLVKFGKTVLSPTTAARNFMSSMFFTLTNGHFDFTQASKSIKSMQVYFKNRGDAAVKEYMENLRRLGVIYESPHAGELMALLKDSQKLEDWINRDKGWFLGLSNATKIGLEFSQKFYSFGDDFYKIIGFENEKAMLMKHRDLTEEEAEKEAAERIRNTYPTYSMIGKGVNALRRFPLVGSFVSFPAEIIRTSYHITNYLAQDIKKYGVTDPLVMRKLAGYSIAAGFIAGLSALSAALRDVSDDEEKALRLMSPEWTKNSNIFWLGRDEKGNREYIDLTFLDPYSYWKKPIMAAIHGESIGGSVVDASKELLSPFFGWDIAAKAITEAAFNKKDSGGKIYNELDSNTAIVGDIADHLRKALQPGVATNIERFILAANGERSKTGKQYKLEEEIEALFGWRTGTFDPKVALYYQAMGYQDQKADASRLLKNVATDINSVSDNELRAAYKQSLEARKKAFNDMKTIVEAGRSAGLSRLQLVSILRNSGISERDASDLAAGREPVFPLSKTMMKSAIKKASVLFDEETKQEFQRRQKLLIDLQKRAKVNLSELDQDE